MCSGSVENMRGSMGNGNVGLCGGHRGKGRGNGGSEIKKHNDWLSLKLLTCE